MKNFINYHVLISHSPSCLNRDDMNMQKSAIFGGERRVRISSQSLKRAMRKSPYFKTSAGCDSTRTRELTSLHSLLSEKLKTQQFPKDLIESALTFLADKRSIQSEDTQADAVAPWCIEEVEWLCNQLSENPEIKKQCEAFVAITGNGDGDKKKKRSIIKAVHSILEKNDQLKGLYHALQNNVDIALHGRMAASGLMMPVDGAMAVAHAITTHNVDADIDWFTAVDDLQELGSGHLDTQEFSSGVFYRYASLNLKQLQMNLGLLPNMNAAETESGRKKALELASHLLHMFATVVPSAKQQSFAAHNLADMALVSFSDVPVSLANAFERPIQKYNGSGFLEPSILALQKYWSQVHTGYGLQENCADFVLSQNETQSGITRKTSLEELKAWIKNDGKE